ncbi:MAG TPA: hypothetical protein VIG40_06760 [Tissierellaceae bacterium]
MKLEEKNIKGKSGKFYRIFFIEIQTYSNEAILEFIQNNIDDKKGNLIVVPAVEAKALTYYRYKEHNKKITDIKAILEEIRNDPNYIVSRLYFISDKLDLLDHEDILSNWEIIKKAPK